MMDDDQPRRDSPRGREGGEGERSNDPDALDTQAILARRRAFVASALAGMTLSAASCEGQVSGSASGNVSVGATSGGTSGTAVTDGAPAQPCLMVAAVNTEDAQRADSGVIALTEQPAGALNAQPCLMVYAPQDASAGSRDASAAGPSLPTGPHASGMPCLSIREPMDAGLTRAQPCLRIAPPRRDAGAVDAATGAPVRDASVRAPTPVPCLEMAVPQPCLTPARHKPEPEDD